MDCRPCIPLLCCVLNPSIVVSAVHEIAGLLCWGTKRWAILWAKRPVDDEIAVFCWVNRGFGDGLRGFIAVCVVGSGNYRVGISTDLLGERPRGQCPNGNANQH
jgi:hypothetical protein